MIKIVKETLDIKVNDPVLAPAPLPCYPNRIQRRLPGTIPVGVRMEMRLDQWLKVQLSYHLSYSVSYCGNTQRPDASIVFRDLDYTDWWWKVASRGHPIPDLVEIILQVLLKRLERLLIDTSSAAFRLDPLVRVPNDLLGNRIRLCFCHELLPIAG